MPDDGMPADPFREGQIDWGPIAATHHAFYVAHLAAGFTHAESLELVSRLMSVTVSLLFSATQQQPEQPEIPQGEQGQE